MEEAAFGETSLGIAVWGREADESKLAQLDDVSGRRAALARCGLLLSTLIYVFGTGAFIGPAWVRLACGNLLVLTLLLVGIETSMKVLGMHFPALVRHTTERNFWVYDRTKGWYHRANGTGAAPLSGPDRAAVRINSAGLRGREISRHKPEGARRVVVVGDSYVFGLGVDLDNAFTTHLETYLNDSFADDDLIEVVNMGVTGYSTDQEYILFQEIGMELAPDLVILVMCDNDFLASTEDFAYKRYYKPYFDLDDDRELSLRGSPVPLLTRAQRIKLFLGQESTLWNFVRSRNSSPAGAVLGSFDVDVPRTSSLTPGDATAALVAGLADRVDVAGANFLVINTAHRGERTPLYHELRPKLERIGIEQLGLEGFLSRARRDHPEMLWDFGEDKHWNRDAHRLAAEIVAGHVFRHGLLP